MNNNQGSIKNTIKRYFVKGDSDIKYTEKIDTPKREKIPYKKVDISKDIQHPGLARAMRALQLSNPFKGV